MADRARAAIKKLLTTDSLPALGPTPRPEAQAEAALNATLTQLFAESNLNSTRQELVRALLFLWHDHLEAAHTFAQISETADGSFPHAIMHRREPDYWNAKYWWRRVGLHPAFPGIAARAGELLEARHEKALKSRLLPGGNWDAGAFVDLCEKAAAMTQPAELLREIQRIEFEVLLEHLLQNDCAR